MDSIADQGCIFIGSDSEISQITNYIKNQYGKQPGKTLRRSGAFIVNFEHISHLVLVFLLLTLSR